VKCILVVVEKVKKEIEMKNQAMPEYVARDSGDEQVVYQ
jgi:hypothetical protein